MKAQRLNNQADIYTFMKDRGGVDLYCSARFDEKYRITLPVGFHTEKHVKNAKRVGWEHVVLDENFGRTFSEWRDRHPTERAKRGFDEFERSHRQYFNRRQIKVLPVGSLEEYYPDHHDWKRTSRQVSGMTGKQKRSLAKRVGEEIEQDHFETEMAVLFESLSDAWQQAF